MKFKFTIFLLITIFCIDLNAQKTATLIYVDQYKDIAIREMKRTGIPASITLAQGIVESNSGESNLALNFNNHFGIKCKTDWKGETTYQDDDAKQECFRVYPNAEASYIDHSNFIKNRPNYAPLFQLDPVDDSAWAIGLKKAGYATAPDYAKKLMKVIDDYELSQYNFPELNDENDSATTETAVVIEQPSVANSATKKWVVKNTNLDKKDSSLSLISVPNKETKLSIDVKKDTIIQIKSMPDSSINVANPPTTIINNIKGIEPTSSNSSTTVIKMNSIGEDTAFFKKVNTNKTTTTKSIQADSISKDVIKHTLVTKTDSIKSSTSTRVPSVKDSSAQKLSHVYPDKPFKINQVPVIWAKAGTSFLQIATENNIPLYKIFVFNDLTESELLEKDQLLFLSNKKIEGDKSFHLVSTSETLYDISQKEGIQLKKLKEYNPNITSNSPAIGTQLLLVKPKEQKSKLLPNK